MSRDPGSEEKQKRNQAESHVAKSPFRPLAKEFSQARHNIGAFDSICMMLSISTNIRIQDYEPTGK